MAYEDFIELAEELISENGELVTLLRRTVTTEGTMPWLPEEMEEAEIPAKAVFFNETFNRKSLQLVKDGGKVAYVSPVGLMVEPDGSVDAVVRSSGERIEVTGVERISPNGEKVLFILALRG